MDDENIQYIGRESEERHLEFVIEQDDGNKYENFNGDEENHVDANSAESELGAIDQKFICQNKCEKIENVGHLPREGRRCHINFEQKFSSSEDETENEDENRMDLNACYEVYQSLKVESKNELTDANPKVCKIVKEEKNMGKHEAYFVDDSHMLGEYKIKLGTNPKSLEGLNRDELDENTKFFFEEDESLKAEPDDEIDEKTRVDLRQVRERDVQDHKLGIESKIETDIERMVEFRKSGRGQDEIFSEESEVEKHKVGCPSDEKHIHQIQSVSPQICGGKEREEKNLAIQAGYFVDDSHMFEEDKMKQGTDTKPFGGLHQEKMDELPKFFCKKDDSLKAVHDDKIDEKTCVELRQVLGIDLQDRNIGIDSETDIERMIEFRNSSRGQDKIVTEESGIEKHKAECTSDEKHTHRVHNVNPSICEIVVEEKNAKKQAGVIRDDSHTLKEEKIKLGTEPNLLGGLNRDEMDEHTKFLCENDSMEAEQDEKIDEKTSVDLREVQERDVQDHKIGKDSKTETGIERMVEFRNSGEGQDKIFTEEKDESNMGKLSEIYVDDSHFHEEDKTKQETDLKLLGLHQEKTDKNQMFFCGEDDALKAGQDDKNDDRNLRISSETETVIERIIYFRKSDRGQNKLLTEEMEIKKLIENCPLDEKSLHQVHSESLANVSEETETSIEETSDKKFEDNHVHNELSIDTNIATSTHVDSDGACEVNKGAKLKATHHCNENVVLSSCVRFLRENTEAGAQKGVAHEYNNIEGSRFQDADHEEILALENPFEHVNAGFMKDEKLVVIISDLKEERDNGEENDTESESDNMEVKTTPAINDGIVKQNEIETSCYVKKGNKRDIEQEQLVGSDQVDTSLCKAVQYVRVKTYKTCFALFSLFLTLAVQVILLDPKLKSMSHSKYSFNGIFSQAEYQTCVLHMPPRPTFLQPEDPIYINNPPPNLNFSSQQQITEQNLPTPNNGADSGLHFNTSSSEIPIDHRQMLRPTSNTTVNEQSFRINRVGSNNIQGHYGNITTADVRSWLPPYPTDEESRTANTTENEHSFRINQAGSNNIQVYYENMTIADVRSWLPPYQTNQERPTANTTENEHSFRINRDDSNSIQYHYENITIADVRTWFSPYPTYVESSGNSSLLRFDSNSTSNIFSEEYILTNETGVINISHGEMRPIASAGGAQTTNQSERTTKPDDCKHNRTYMYLSQPVGELHASDQLSRLFNQAETEQMTSNRHLQFYSNNQSEADESVAFEFVYSEFARLNTYFDGWPHDSPGPEVMSKAGFIYTGIDDVARCITCGSCFDHWKAVKTV